MSSCPRLLAVVREVPMRLSKNECLLLEQTSTGGPRAQTARLSIAFPRVAILPSILRLLSGSRVFVFSCSPFLSGTRGVKQKVRAVGTKGCMDWRCCVLVALSSRHARWLLLRSGAFTDENEVCKGGVDGQELWNFKVVARTSKDSKRSIAESWEEMGEEREEQGKEVHVPFTAWKWAWESEWEHETGQVLKTTLAAVFLPYKMQRLFRPLVKIDDVCFLEPWDWVLFFF